MSLHSIVKGSGAPYNIWIHAFFGTGQNFAGIAPSITGTNYLIDLPNHGNSYHARYKTHEGIGEHILKFAEDN